MVEQSLLDRLDRAGGNVRWTELYPRRIGDWPARGVTPEGRTRFGIVDPTTATTQPICPHDDPQLPALRRALQRGTLVGYRPTRRAIVGTGSTYIKIVRTGRGGPIAARYKACRSTTADVVIPEVTQSTGDTVELSRVPGVPLHQLLMQDAPDTTDILGWVGAALARFHAASAGCAPYTDGEKPLDWMQIVDRAEPLDGSYAQTAMVLRRSVATGTLGRIHGDLHDKQIIVGPSIGLIDLDTLRPGYIEEDIGNLLAHFELRQLQLGRTIEPNWANALFDGYTKINPIEIQAVDAYRRTTLFRLACLYRFRRRWLHLPAPLLRHAGNRALSLWL